MVTLLASIAGFIGSIIPEFFKIVRDSNDKRHELAILDRQIESHKNGMVNKNQEIINYADISESRALYRTYKSGIHWVDALNATVRPVIAYSFFLLYSLVKLMHFYQLSEVAAAFNNYEILWNDDDQAIFAGIISFYFGQRAITKLSRNK